MPKVSTAKSTSPLGGELADYVQRTTVTVTKSVTKNLGNYNSAKVEVGVTLPVDPTAEEIKKARDTINIAIVIVDDMLEQEVIKLES